MTALAGAFTRIAGAANGFGNRSLTRTTGVEGGAHAWPNDGTSRDEDNENVGPVFQSYINSIWYLVRFW